MGEERANRFNVQLDDEHALKLHRVAERTYVQPGTIARSLLSTALDQVDPDATTITELLDSIPAHGSGHNRGSPILRLVGSSRSTNSDDRGRRHRDGPGGPRSPHSNASTAGLDAGSSAGCHRTTCRVSAPGQGAWGRWTGFRVVLGPWPWMLIVYAFDEPGDRVSIVTVQDVGAGRDR